MSTDALFAEPALFFPDVKGVASSPVVRVHRPRNATTTLAVAARFEALTRSAEVPESSADGLTRLSARLRRCATDSAGWRCGSVLCPRCARRMARRYSSRVADAFLRSSAQLAFITLTAPHNDLAGGLSLLKRAFAQLRRRAVWAKALGRGMAFVEMDLTGRSRISWNVHLHAIVVLHGNLPGTVAVGAAWRECLAPFGTTGSADCKRVNRRSVAHRRHHG